MKESSKAMRRRFCEDLRGTASLPWRTIFEGVGIDVGAGDDPIQIAGCVPFDKDDGDANRLSDYFPENHFDYIHASQVLEHLHEPVKTLKEWGRLIKPGTGRIVVTIPDFDLYEKCQFPSKFNPDHKAVFSLWRKKSPGAFRLFHVPTMLGQTGLSVELCHLVTTNYDWNLPDSVDQTLPESGAECFIEFVLSK
jgi:SAM-dependent methyltransferase